MRVLVIRKSNVLNVDLNGCFRSGGRARRKEAEGIGHGVKDKKEGRGDIEGLRNCEIKKLRDDLTIKFYKSPKWMFQTLIRNNNPDEIIRLLKAAKDYLFYLFQRK